MEENYHLHIFLISTSISLQLSSKKYFGSSTGNKIVSCKNPTERLAYGSANGNYLVKYFLR